ncbi:MAG: Rho termination factor N-terminal domain-containing protein, partial [Acidimicrobiia bacterium]|nr:Rho termination factor N-terminal domain-containing protein [Acidimicrobiia bacterium]
MEPTLDRSGLTTKSKADLGDIAKSLGIKGTSSLRKEQIIDRILENTGHD